MAGFTFDADDEARRVNGETDNIGASAERPGSGSGAGSTTDGNSGTENGNNGTASSAASSGADATKRRRGRKPFPRDADGNIIRPAPGSDSGTNKGKQKGLDLEFTPNDRAQVRQNITGLHAMAAVLLKQPIMNLKPEEAEALTDALCNVADYHKINLLQKGGAFGLYASLATTAYMIYVPRIIYMKQIRASDQAKPANPGEYTEHAETTQRSGTMDYSADTTH